MPFINGKFWMNPSYGRAVESARGAEIKGSATVGAAALDPPFFRRFLVIQKGESLGTPFDIHGEAAVTTDFATERRIKLRARDFLLRELHIR